MAPTAYIVVLFAIRESLEASADIIGKGVKAIVPYALNDADYHFRFS